jgi:hypothetical protein
MLWVVTLLYGLCMASIYALIFSFPFQLGLTITGRTSSIFIVGASFGGMLVPLGAGFLFNHIAASLLMWTILGGNLLLIGAFFILAFLIPRCTGAAISTARSGDCLHSVAPDQAEKGFVLVAVDKQEKIHVSQA